MKVDREEWSESMRSDIARHLDIVRAETSNPRDPRMDSVFRDVVEALSWAESRLAWLRYTAECPSSSFDSGDAGALARAEARPLSPAV